MQSKITSLTNAKVKNVIRLRQRKYRKAYSLTIIEGIKEITNALNSSVSFVEIYHCPKILKEKDQELLRRLSSLDMPVYETTETVFSKLSYGDRLEGALAVCRIPESTLGVLSPKKDALYIVLEKVEKPGNLGAVLRTADAVGVSGVLICDPMTDLYNPNVIRSSLGAVFCVPTVSSTNELVYEFLTSNNVSICATLPHAKKRYYQADLSGPTAIVLGSEQQGLTGFWKSHADQKIRIPMKGQVDSLNVSVSAAVILYEANRQKER